MSVGRSLTHWIIALGSVAALLIASGCSSSKQNYLLEAPAYGFVPEVEEPGVRGQIVRVSPENLEVLGHMALSPDGQWIVCSARATDGSDAAPFELYKINVRGGGAPVKLTSGSRESAFYPSFTSDGEWIVFGAGGAFWKMRADGAGARIKVGGSGLGYDCCGQLSTAGRLAFTSIESRVPAYLSRSSRIPTQVLAASTSLIWTVEEDGGELTQFREGSSPAWSPTGDRIAFDYDGDIWIMDADGRNLTQVTDTAGIDEGLPCFSPDGKELVYVSNARGPNAGRDYNIWAMTLDSFQKRQVTQLESWDSWPVWHPDGILFLSGRGSRGAKVTRIWMYRTR